MHNLQQLPAGSKILLSGNEAIALGAYHAGLKVATAYPGTPSTEILENLVHFDGVYGEWSTNEKVAVEVAMGASYAGVRCLASMKHVGLNVAADSLLSASITGVNGGLVIVSADDPGMHSSQNEQDNRHYARLAKIPVIEPYDSQSAYDFIFLAFEISEQYDTPVLFRTTTRVSHSKSVVQIRGSCRENIETAQFATNPEKYVMLPAYARKRHVAIEKRIQQLKEYVETSPLNKIIEGKGPLGIITCGIAYQYAREVFPAAPILRLGMTYPLPKELVTRFSAGVNKLIVIEELDPFVEDIVKSMGIAASGKSFIPIIGELSPEIVASSAKKAGILTEIQSEGTTSCQAELPARPPSLCPGCPHRGLFYALARNPRRIKKMATGANSQAQGGLVISGDIGCYTLGAYPPLNGLDTCACMGASIGHALGMEKAGLTDKLVAVIGDSTFMHSGLTALADAVYNHSSITIVILDNMTTAMTGHQGHPATGIAASGEKVQAVSLENVVKGMGVEEVAVINAFDIPALRDAVKTAIESEKLYVLIVRGECAPLRRHSDASRIVDIEKCTRCNTCFKLACPAIQYQNDMVYIDPNLCAGDNCGLCEQVCPVGAIGVFGKAVKE
ncbi:MAG: indolepyruvate ferredoxin oxidoreductase subunit alpha [Dehalococcoidales bacterium]|nr:indolepyruvate ferredoxin oxidoreductase subunit alpha [Dehalococcoidales bacterium]